LFNTGETLKIALRETSKKVRQSCKSKSHVRLTQGEVNSATKQTRGVSHCHLAIYIENCLKGKRRIMETQIFHLTKILSSKNPLKETKNLQDIMIL
jgi:hypothetical protein